MGESFDEVKNTNNGGVRQFVGLEQSELIPPGFVSAKSQRYHVNVVG